MSTKPGEDQVDEARRERFAGEPGLGTSLHRNFEDPVRFYEEARAIVANGGALPNRGRLAFDFEAEAGGPRIGFRFSGRDDAVAPEVGPSRRVVVLVGPNGVGKTHLLARIARLAYAPPLERERLADQGRLIDAPAFPNLVAVSYSAFDTFEPPRLEGEDPAVLAQQLSDGVGRYIYCGLRNLIVRVAEPGAPNQLMDERTFATVFERRLQRVVDRERAGLLRRVLRPLLDDEGFRQTVSKPDAQVEDLADEARRAAVFEQITRDPVWAFSRLSSGHKIVLHMLTSLTAALDGRGLALIDEPETHLHPPLLAALMGGLRDLLAQLGAFAIVATHSPVVAQETLASQVLIFDAGGGLFVRPAQIETFGENVGTLTREIFGMHTDLADYRGVLTEMAQRRGSIDGVEKELGTLLSGPALAHVMAVLDVDA